MNHIVESLRPLETPISQLKPDPTNARIHDRTNIGAIRSSLRRFGQVKPIVALDDGTVIAGNGTLTAAKAEGWTSIAVVRAKYDEVTAKAYAIADNRTAELASWDDDQLAKTLREIMDSEINVDNDLIDATGFDVTEVENYLRLNDNPSAPESDLYTKKIQVPIYTPVGDCPEISELADISKAHALATKVDEADLPEEVKVFLKAAAMRHVVFNYEKIAEFYAHASPDTQKLMEESALVILDINRAIEQGFIAMSEQLAEAYRDDSQPS